MNKKKWSVDDTTRTPYVVSPSVDTTGMDVVRMSEIPLCVVHIRTTYTVVLFTPYDRVPTPYPRESFTNREWSRRSQVTR